jgi:hypothetical protein
MGRSNAQYGEEIAAIDNAVFLAEVNEHIKHSPGALIWQRTGEILKGFEIRKQLTVLAFEVILEPLEVMVVRADVVDTALTHPAQVRADAAHVGAVPHQLTSG